MTRLIGMLPAPFRDPAQRGALLAWLGVGLAVRLLLMPFAVSADLLAVYWRSHLIAYDGEVFSSYLVNMGAHYVHALSLRLFGFLLPPAHEVWTHPWWWSDSSALSPQVQLELSTSDHVHATLFALKLPYLIADLVTGLLILALVAGAGSAFVARRRRLDLGEPPVVDPRLVRRAWAFWMLSPIGLYASYVFGRYEALAVVFVVAALLCVERDRPWWGAVLLGIGITMRGYPLLLVPVFALVVFRRPLRQALWAGVALAPFALVMASNRLLAGTVGELARLQDFATGSTFFAYTIPVDGDGQLYIFFAFALGVYGVLAGRAWGWWGSAPLADRRPAETAPGPALAPLADRRPAETAPGPALAPLADRRPVRGELWLWLLVFHAGMFALATFSAHYFMWFTPFVAIAIARRHTWRGVLPLHLVQALLVFALTDLLGGPGTLLGLFEPVDPDLATSLPNLREAFLLDGDRRMQLLGLVRTAFAVATALLVTPALRELRHSAPTAVVRGAEDRQRQAAEQQA